MVPDVAKTGHSFKGALAYYLHDKRPDGARAGPATAERVAWTETRNLATDDPQAAKAIMIATARQADQLKAAAGIKAGRKATTGAVYAYSLAWHPDEAATLDRAEMMRAAESSLKALKADHLQAVIVCHRDQKHPHLHIILNRVDPATGKQHATSNDFRKLSDWAHQYEKERGPIFTPKRAENQALREQFAKARAADPQPAKKPAVDPARPEKVAPAKPAAADRLKSPAQLIVERAEAMKARHKQEWATLAALQKARRDEIFSRAKQQQAALFAQQKEDMRPQWRDLYKRQRQETRTYEQREKRIMGVVQNAFAIARQQRDERGRQDTGFLSMAFNYTVNREARRAAFDGRQAAEKAALMKQAQERAAANAAVVRAGRGVALDELRDRYAQQRTAQIKRQNEEQKGIRDEWRAYYARRDAATAANEKPVPASGERVRHARSEERAYRPRRQRERPRNAPPVDNQAKARDATRSAPPGTASPQGKEPMKRDFDRAAPSPAAEKAPPIQPTETHRISVPDAAPAPGGEVPRRPSVEREIPVKDMPKPEPYFVRKERPAEPKKAPDPPKPIEPYFTRKARPQEPPAQKVAPAKQPEPAKPSSRQEAWKAAAQPQPEKPTLRQAWKEGVTPADRKNQPAQDRSPERER